MRALELKIPPVAIGLILAALMGLAARLVPWFGFALPGGRAIAIGFVSAGVLAGILGVVSFRRAKTTVNPLTPEASSRLVVTGIFRHTRNPMYLGMLLVLLGWATWLGNLAALVSAGAFVLLMNRLQIVPEERALAARYGAEFAAYRSAVRRWL